MKSLMLLTLIAAPAFAAEIPSTYLAQALVDKSESITKLKSDCTSGVRGVKSEQVSAGVFKHTLTLARDFRGQPGKDCKVEITQDFRPTYVDGAVDYEVVVSEISR